MPKIRAAVPDERNRRNGGTRELDRATTAANGTLSTEAAGSLFFGRSRTMPPCDDQAAGRAAEPAQDISALLD